jgi:hypothetical protein
MKQEFVQAFDQFIAKYTELLTGRVDDETIEKVKIFALYSHVNKTMPALAKHWISDNPEAKDVVRAIFEEIQRLNQQRDSSS